jgi:hypothetical protein
MPNLRLHYAMAVMSVRPGGLHERFGATKDIKADTQVKIGNTTIHRSSKMSLLKWL